MMIDSYLLLLAGTYLAFLMLGFFFYYTTAKVNSLKWKAGNNVLKVFRFVMYVVLLPVAVTCAAMLYFIYKGYIVLF